MNTDAIERRWAELAPLFDAAVELADDARDAFVAAIDDSELRSALQVMLAAARQSGALDDGPASPAARLLDASEGLQGRRLGAWRVGPKIGSGGMASVFRATRADGAFEQQAAIKVLRHGLHDAWERERFVRERAVLAKLEHPDIARVLDGGLTPEGVPWFAMEFVDGVPITEHCDAHALDIDGRVRLFERLCVAVDHAHRNLVVHRDLKPSNILVSADGAPRLLDFGIAKLIGDGDGGDDDTRTLARRMTPAYAAPEQASGEAITTATDVYALGVLLHELLTGARPQRREDGSLRSASATVTGPDAPASAVARADTPRGLRRRLAGELDLIVARALARDPAQRYAGAAQLADDLARWRGGRPIRARPDAAGYRLRKFAWRHRRALAIGALLLLVLCGGLVATLWQARSARLEAARADATRDFVLSLFAGVTPDEARGRDIGARELLDRGAARLAETLREQPEAQSVLAAALAGAYRQLGGYERAAELAAQARDAAATPEHRVRALLELGSTRAAQGRYDDAEQALREALADAPDALATDVQLRLAEVAVERGSEDAKALAEQALASARVRDEQQRIAHALGVLGAIQFRGGDLDGAAASLRESLALQRRLHGDEHTESARAAHDLGVVVLQQGDAKAAAALFEQALANRRALLGGEHPDVADSQYNLGIALRRLGRDERATELIDAAVAMQKKLLGPAHPLVANGLNSQAVHAFSQGDLATAIAYVGEALASAAAAYGERHATVIAMRNNLAGMQRAAGRLDDAEASARRAIADAAAGPGSDHYLYGIARLALGGIHAERGAFEAALAETEAAHATLAAALGAGHPDALLALAMQADLERELGRDDAAQMHVREALDGSVKALASGNPRIGRVRLIAAEIAAARHECNTAMPLYADADADFAKGGATTRSDLVLAKVGQARCLRDDGQAARADAMLDEARAIAAQLPYRSRRVVTALR